MRQLLENVDSVRREVSHSINQKLKSELGQFMTPITIAKFMASLFPSSNLSTCHLLDAGAGVGSLTCAFLDHWLSGNFKFTRVEAFAYEIDNTLRKHLEKNISSYSHKKNLEKNIIAGDFIELATDILHSSNFKGNFSHAILNPPYKKIKSDSPHRLMLRRVGIETVNLYSAFVSLAIALMANGGQIVAIIPRSFCNGPYYRPFRNFLLEHVAINHIHLFNSRNKAFKDDEVLQENIIVLLERSGKQKDVTISVSTDDSFTDITTKTHPFNRIVFPDDPEKFIHIPTSTEHSALELSEVTRCTLNEINVQISTGPVVDFRLKDHLRNMPEHGTVPLLYPTHFNGQQTIWPKTESKKPNAIHRNEQTEKWLYPNGFYCVVRRFSSKEEARRIVASVVQPHMFEGNEFLGFENHLNVFHEKKQPLPEALAKGLAIFLNTTAVDENFRKFNGHTQVNATDLKGMKYPSRNDLISLGEWAMSLTDEPTQVMIDERFKNWIT